MAKRPPSPSGIALYADVFADVLRSIGPLTWISAPSDPSESQTLRAAIRGFRLGRSAAAGDASLTHVELSGRALFEFYFCLGFLSRRRPSGLLAITLHDAPSIVGACLLFACLDVRGLRRLGLWLSAGLGSRLERRVMKRSDAAFALTAAGADRLSADYGRSVSPLPHVVLPAPRAATGHVVFIPGYVSDAVGILAIARAVELSDESGRSWSVRVGSCPERVVDHVRGTATPAEWSRLTFLGHVSEPALREEFRAATIVARLVDGPAANSLAASGPLSWAIAAAAAVVTNDRRAGAVELARQGAIVVCSDPSREVAVLVSDGERLGGLRTRARRAAEAMSVDAVGKAYRRALPPPRGDCSYFESSSPSRSTRERR